MYQELLEEIAKELEGRGEDLQPPCSADSLKQLGDMAQAVLSCSIPEEYTEFLSMTNGLDWNGLVIYASATTPIVGLDDALIQGFVEANFLWRDYKPNENYLIFGESGLSKYVYNTARSEYQVIDRSSMGIVESVESFTVLLKRAFWWITVESNHDSVLNRS